MLLIWVGFILFVLAMLAIDLFLVNRKAAEINVGHALRFTAVTVILALGFAVVVYFIFENRWMGFGEYYAREYPGESLGKHATMDYLAAWILEYSLSVDNIFVIAVIFSYFGVPAKYQHRVLFWGILGALIMRGAMIAAGAALVHHFEWLIAVFGVILLLTAVKMLKVGDEPVHPEKNIAIRIAKAVFPVTSDFHGEKFFVRRQPDPGSGVRAGIAMTPLFLVLLVIETTDVVFAVDSIPAVLAITHDPFIVFTSNVFAILGLRSMYFALGAFLRSFKYLKTSLVFVLAFIGIKMLMAGVPIALNALYMLGKGPNPEVGPPLPLPFEPVKIPNEISLPVIAGILGVGVVTSIMSNRAERRASQTPLDDLTEAADIAFRNARRLAILVIGLTILAFSIPIGLLPGPGGIFVAIAGLVVLATEFIWAQRILTKLRKEAQRLQAGADSVARKTNPLLVPLAIVAYWAVVFVLAHQITYFNNHIVKVYFVGLGCFFPVGYWGYRVLAEARARRKSKK
jgi:tellurite resistance protein TerC